VTLTSKTAAYLCKFPGRAGTDKKGPELLGFPSMPSVTLSIYNVYLQGLGRTNNTPQRRLLRKGLAKDLIFHKDFHKSR
jgi:hypothetical protein